VETLLEALNKASQRLRELAASAACFNCNMATGKEKANAQIFYVFAAGGLLL
jgi:hypothetical protein